MAERPFLILSFGLQLFLLPTALGARPQGLSDIVGRLAAREPDPASVLNEIKDLQLTAPQLAELHGIATRR